MEREKISWSHHKALPGLERCCAGLDVGRARALGPAGSWEVTWRLAGAPEPRGPSGEPEPGWRGAEAGR